MTALRSVPSKHHLDSAHMRFCLKFSDDFDFGRGGKLPGLIGGGESWRRSGSRPDGANGWMVRFIWEEEGELAIDAYLPRTGNGKWNDNLIPVNMKLNRGQWHCIEQFIDIGTPGNDDATLKVWIDDVEMISINDIRVLNEDTNAGKVGGIYFSSFHGGGDASWAPSVDSQIQFDGIVVATGDRIMTPRVTTAPQPPGSLQIQ